MIVLKWILFFLNTRQILASRAGITHCSGTSYPSSISGSGSASTSGTHYMMQDPNYQFQCCGVVERIRFVGSPGSVSLQIWRQNDNSNFELVSYTRSAYTLSGSPYVVADDERVSFREGDLFGWSGGSVRKTASSSIFLNWYSSAVSFSAVGDTHTWYSENVDQDQEYLIQLRTAASTAPYFRNLPTTLQYADTELLVGGITLMTLSYNDLDPDDAADLTVSLSPAWNDLFRLTTGATPDLIQTQESLGPGTYRPEFLIEEGHCGVSATATLTVTVTDSVPSIDNLPASITLHEDDLDARLLYTVTMSDPTNQPMWCQGDWTIGKPVDSATPFIVKMLSTAAGSSQAGIYLIEDPQLDYGTASTYDLTVKCQDTYGHEVTGKYYVSIIENQKPLFYNLGNMVEVDATVHGTGTTAFTVSSTDADNDQITYTYSCSPAATCPVALYDSGEVVVTDNLLSWTANKYTLTIRANDLRDSSAVTRDLIVYISNINNVPTFSNVNGNNASVDENVALGKSLYQMSASDTDSGDTLTYYMVIDDPQGYDLFEMSSSGRLTTHSIHSIDFELLSTTSYTLSVYVNDAKVQYMETFTVTVTDVNEAPEFLSSEYVVTQDEGQAGEFTDNPSIIAIDVDAGDTLMYTRDCGTYDAYITLDPSSALLSFAQDYDLDNTTLGLPTFIQCTVYVHDAGGLNDSTRLYINVEYTYDTSPVFNPDTYNVEVNSDTPMGYAVIRVTATDRDVGDVLYYSLDQSNLSDSYFVVESNGIIYANQLLNPLKSERTGAITVTVTDSGGNTGTTTVTMTFNDITAVPSVTTDRNWEFIEDPTNITWLTASVVTIVTCAGIILCTVTIYCMRREKPFIDFKKLFPKKKPKRPLDKRRRKMPLGRQEMPLYRHIHSDEVLRHSPIQVASPAPVDPTSLRPGSGTSGRVTGTSSSLFSLGLNVAPTANPSGDFPSFDVEEDPMCTPGQNQRLSITEVRVNEDESSWMDGYETPDVATGPLKSVTHPKSEEWEYMNPTRGSSLSREQMYGTPSSQEPRSLSKQRRSSSQRITRAIHVPVSPYIPSDDAYNDDFRSERISIATPESVLSRQQSPPF